VATAGRRHEHIARTEHPAQSKKGSKMASTLKDIQIDDLRAELSGELITFDDPG
jgi:hypothetical protein